jgi:hypothetical protein
MKNFSLMSKKSDYEHFTTAFLWTSPYNVRNSKYVLSYYEHL